MNDDNQTLLLLIGLWLINKVNAFGAAAVPAIQRGGATVYDVLHDDAGHKNDLPGKQLTPAAVLQIATKAGFPNPKLAAAIALAESGGVVNAIVRSSRENSHGLWQINLNRWPYTERDMMDPAKNAAAAYKISKGGTVWTDWSTFNKGKYKAFLTGVLS